MSRLNVLFIGNSITARSDLPNLIARMAAKRGREMQYRLISTGGASLRTHWNAGESLAAISEGQFGRVVLQEQSTLPIKNAARMHDNVRLFDGAIMSVKAKTILYMTWARKNAPETQEAITGAYLAIGTELAATVAPVGLAWQSFLRKHKTPVLHDKDLSHPTLAGSYLAACVFMAVLFQENPVGIDLDVARLGASDQIALQKVAWQVCKSATPKHRTSAKRAVK